MRSQEQNKTSKLPYLAICFDNYIGFSYPHYIFFLLPSILSLCVSFCRVMMNFASTHGENIRLENGRQSAHRFKDNSKGVVITSAPLQSDQLFQVII